MPTCTKGGPVCDCGKVHNVLNLRSPKRRLSHLRIDPSRTARIQKRFTNELKIRVRAIKRNIRTWIVDNDELGLKPVHNAGTYRFSTNPAKVKAFKSWLQDQVDLGLLSTDASQSNNWTSKYIQSAYKQGVLRSYADVKGLPSGKGTDFYKGGQAQFVQDSFLAPVRADAVELLATRTYNELEGFTNKMGTQLNRIMSSGLANGDSPSDIADEMMDTIDGLTEGQAMTIARTETAYAQSEGQLNAFEDLGVEQVGLLAEISTAGDNRVCDACEEAAANGPYTIEEARGILPVHPNCRCAWSLTTDNS